MFESNFYMDAATKAAHAERTEAFTYAEQLWESAAYSAVSKLNRHWAQARADFCRRQYDLSQIENWEQEVVNA